MYSDKYHSSTLQTRLSSSVCVCAYPLSLRIYQSSATILSSNAHIGRDTTYCCESTWNGIILNISVQAWSATQPVVTMTKKYEWHRTKGLQPSSFTTVFYPAPMHQRFIAHSTNCRTRKVLIPLLVALVSSSYGHSTFYDRNKQFNPVCSSHSSNLALHP